MKIGSKLIWLGVFIAGGVGSILSELLTQNLMAKMMSPRTEETGTEDAEETEED